MANQVDHLNSLLKGELSAVQTYEMALEKAVKTPEVVAVLEENKRCHAARASKISELVATAGGTPCADSGAWGAFAKAVEAGSTILGEGAALGSLQEGEDHGIELYKSEMKHLEGTLLNVVQNELYPKQEGTQKALDNLLEKKH